MAGAADTIAVQQLASRLWPNGPHPGAVGWEAASDQLPAQTVLADDDGVVLGWAGLTAGELVVHADPATAAAARGLVGWAVAAAGDRDSEAAERVAVHRAAWRPVTMPWPAEIEPLGVVPEHRRIGLASALCLQVAAQVAAHGGDLVYINTGPNPDYPAPAATYVTVGFEVTPRDRRYHRPGSTLRNL